MLKVQPKQQKDAYSDHERWTLFIAFQSEDKVLLPSRGSGDGQIVTGKESATPTPPPAPRKTNNDNSNKNSAMGPPKRRGRPRKLHQSPLATSSNPYEFYYYSGFGPRWGKRRGSDQKHPAEEDSAIADRNNSKKRKEFGNGGSSSSYSQMEETDEELDFIDDDFDVLESG